MGSDRFRLLALWRLHAAEAGLNETADAIGRKLIARHSKPWRHYHGLSHLSFLFDEIDACAALLQDIARVRFAAWFHDAIYVTWRKDNEMRSAHLARRDLLRAGASPKTVERTAALIEATADHARGGGDQDDDLFLDMDCAILGAPEPVYERYSRGVRREYWWAPAGAYRTARAAFLRAQLEREAIFLTERYEARLGEQARRNMHAELARL